jgi:hypothetical protein
MLYATHRTIEEIRIMRWSFSIALVLAGCLSAAAQTPPQTPAQAPAQTPAQTPATAPQKPAATQPQSTPASTGSSNAFPTDTTNIPVVSTNPAAADRVATGGEARPMPLPGVDNDPVRSPDDASAPDDAQGDNSSSSSSSAGMDRLLPKPGDDEPDRKRKPGAKEPTKVEVASEDINVGDYYLQTKNWKAALSRFESAMVLAPDNPEVFWGLAEADRHLGALADARKYYQIVVDYDPDSRHGKDARKALKDPEIANAKAAPPAAPGVK